MTAGENQAEPIVRKVHEAILKIRAGREAGELGSIAQRSLLLAPDVVAAHGVDELPMCRSSNPASGAFRDTFFRPSCERCRESLLHRLFGTIEGTRDSNQSREDPARLLAKHGFRDGADISHSPRRLDQWRPPTPDARGYQEADESRRSLRRLCTWSGCARPTRWPRPGFHNSGCSSRRAAPWFRRRGRR